MSFIYFTTWTTGVVHLADFDKVHRGTPRPATLCGKMYVDRLREGDETPSGFLATCKLCRRIRKDMAVR